MQAGANRRRLIVAVLWSDDALLEGLSNSWIDFRYGRVLRLVRSAIKVSPTPSKLIPGYRLDRYELLCPVAEGGMAAVWLARFQGKHGFEKLVVLKMILPAYASDPRFHRMFLDEAAIASRIEHQNVAQILDLGEYDGTLYLVMEWVDGASISRLDRAVRASGGIPLPFTLRIMADSCAGLHAAHELRDAAGHSLDVVHRDVSPQNILVSSHGVIKVIDFGIAKARDRAAEKTRTGVFKGKLYYAAPEQALGMVLDRRADVWAAAAVLYRLITGRYVYDNGDRAETLRRLTTNAPIAPLPPHVSRDLADTINKALSFEPDARHETCAALQNELETAMKSSRLYARPGELGAFVGRHLSGHLGGRRQAIALSLGKSNEPDAHSASVTVNLKAAQGGLHAAGASHQELPSTRAPAPAPAPATRRIWGTTFSNTFLTVDSTRVDVRPVISIRRVATALAVITVVAVGILATKLEIGHGDAGTPVRQARTVHNDRSEPGARAELGHTDPRIVVWPPARVVSVESLPLIGKNSKSTDHWQIPPQRAPSKGRAKKRVTVDVGF